MSRALGPSLTLVGLLGSPASALALSLPDCLALARERAVPAAQGRIARRQAEAAYREASAARLPQLSAHAAYDKSDDVATQLPDANNAAVRVEQTLTPFSPEWGVARQRKVELSAAELERLQTQRDVERRVRQLYFGLLQGRQALENIDAVRKELEKLLTAVLPRFTMGRAPPFDLVKVKSAIADLEKSRGDQEAALIGETAELAQTLGLGATAQLELSPLSREPAIPRDDDVARDIDANPGLKALAERAAAARLAVTTTRYQRAPSLVGAGEYGYAGQTPSGTTKGWDLSLSLRLPLFDWGVISSRVDQQSAASELALGRLEQGRQDLVARALQSRSQARVDLSRSERLRGLLPDARRAAAASIDRYRRGAATILEATEAVNLWLSTLLDERAAYYSYLSDLADLRWLEGLEPDPDGL